ncbi:hypothetical protein ANN_03705 [Periplaneta americana]|uniref:Mos1 transposase HTH domain-containing protein n=1 Tax=Periplaneta americana TaxID=6978 RepID=A0ABQ8TZQ6_PERAM|nr:hypothetical protein ANN_03705 [Periplaneta americana]
MFKVIKHPSDCEMRSVIRFLNARNIKPADIHRQLCEVYGDDAISDGMVRRWVRKFKEGRVSVHDEQHTDRPSLVNDNLHLKKFLGGQRFDGDDTQNLISKFGWKQIDQLPYSPDLAPSDFHLFLHLKKFLGGQRFDGDDTQNLISKFGWEQIDHPPYSPDLAPSDFHLFLHLKKFLCGQRFDGDEVKTAVPTSLLLASRSHAGAEVDDHPTRMEVSCA